MKAQKNYLLLLVLLFGCRNGSDADKGFIEDVLKGFPNSEFYEKRTWVLESGFHLSDESSLTLKYLNKDTIINCHLKKTVSEDTVEYFREADVVYLDGRQKNILRILDEYDTLYHFRVRNDFDFQTMDRADTILFFFVKGKYSYLYENFYYDSCQMNYYIAHMDSLQKVKGSVVRKLPSCL
jgi:hypothetical protein